MRSCNLLLLISFSVSRMFEITGKKDRSCAWLSVSLFTNRNVAVAEKQVVDKEHQMFLQEVFDAAEKLRLTTPSASSAPENNSVSTFDINEKRNREVLSHHCVHSASEKEGANDTSIQQSTCQYTSLSGIRPSPEATATLQMKYTRSHVGFASQTYNGSIENQNAREWEKREFQKLPSMHIGSRWLQNDIDEPSRKRRCPGSKSVPVNTIPSSILSPPLIQFPTTKAAFTENSSHFKHKSFEAQEGHIPAVHNVHLRINPSKIILSPEPLVTQTQLRRVSIDNGPMPVRENDGNAVQPSKVDETLSAKRNRRRKRSPKNLSCPHCDVKFRQPSAVKSHIRTVHLRERRFACPRIGCSQRFGASGDVTRHVDSVHLEKREFKCDICGVLLSRNTVRYRHMRHVHGVEPHPPRNAKSF